MDLNKNSMFKDFFDQLIDKKSLIVAFIIWIVENILGISFLYFSQTIMDTSLVGIIQVAAIKLMSLIFVYIIVANLNRLYKNLKQNKNILEIIITLSFFIITFILLLLIWPGTWSWDDIGIINNCANYSLTPWQHFMSGLYMGACLQILPLAAGFVIIQIIFASFIVGYSVNSIMNILNIHNKMKRIIITILIFLPTIFPPLLMYVLSGFRMGIYTYLDLLLISKLLVLYFRKNKINNCDIFYIVLLTIIIASWRTEAIYYTFAIAIILLLFGRKKISLKRIIVILFCTLLTSLAIMKINNHLIGSKNYSITAIINPLAEVVRKADKEIDQNELNEINDIFEIDKIYNTDKSGITLYWEGIVRKNYSDEDYKEMMNSFIKLLKKYPKSALKMIGENFYDTTGLSSIEDGKNRIAFNFGTIEINKQNTRVGKWWSKINSIFKYPKNFSLRNKTVLMLSCMDENFNVNILYYALWNFLIPLSLCVIAVVLLLVNKKWSLLFIGLTILGRVPIVCLTSPSPYIMYYLPVYLMGYIFTIFTITYLLKNAKKNNICRRLIDYFWNIYEKYEEIVNYLIAGALGVLVSIVSFKFFRVLNFSVISSNIFSWIIAVICMFVLNKFFVFKTDNNKSKMFKELYSFVLARILTLIIETLIVFIGIEKLQGNETIIKIIGQVVIIVLNYILSKIWIFRSKENSTQNN